MFLYNYLEVLLWELLYSFCQDADNPAPGTVLDHSVTKRDWFDFLLVSKHVGQGTVSPTHTDLKPDILQKISYKLTHMYYNWPGTVRVPAPVQYAHKFANLVNMFLFILYNTST